MPYYFYAISIFVSAFLLFLIQPMIGKILLPWFGGTTTVWSTILLFSQVVLTAGYAYAYFLLGKLRSRWQGIVHVALLGISLTFLLNAALSWPSPLTPDISWRPASSDRPIWDLLRILGVIIGLEFLLLAANSTLMQAWFHRDYPQPTPYRLYALSNSGSLLALLSYPLLFEPNLTLKSQAYFWAVGYLFFAATAVYLAVRTLRWKGHSDDAARQKSEATPAKSRDGRHYLLWIALSASATILLVSMTSEITQEVAVVPFLWVLPLSIYLLTFIFAFSGGILYSRNIYLVMFVVLALGSRMLLSIPADSIPLQIAIFSLVLFVGCMLVHNELYRLRPEASSLPAFYLTVAVGGALGGIFVNLVAPLVFATGFWELQWGLIIVGLLMAVIIYREPDGTASRPRAKKESARPKKSRLRAKPALIALLIIVLLQVIYVVYYMREVALETEMATRNFYGILRVWQINEEQPQLLANQLTHGKTAHGFQFEAEEFRALPTTYYAPESGVGVALNSHPKRGRGLRVGGLGLGIGIIGAYGLENDVYRFYEVNPDVIDIAEGEGGYFTYLADSEAEIELVAGDARVALEEELLRDGSQQFDMLVIDTFSGDTIPLHLLTREAFDIYLAHLADGGIMAINVSNKLFDLPQAIFPLADALGLNAALIAGKGDGLQSYDSVWMLLTTDPVFLELPFIASRTIERPGPSTNYRLWTDDYSNLLQILK